jgi:prepilin-type N-terminal cleavage/methylation domain-containing protein
MRNEKGFTLIELLVVILIIGILIMMIIPNFVLFQDRARQSNVKTAMHTVRVVLEAYSVDHFGFFPPAEAYSWGLDYAPGEETDPGDPVSYFPGGTPFATADAGIAGLMPRNPYNGFPYNNGDIGIENLVYCFDDQIGVQDGSSWDDDCRNITLGECLYDNFYIDDGTFAGTIYIMPGTATGDAGEPVMNYGVCGFGKFMEDGVPMYNAIPSPDDPTEILFQYYVLSN